MRFPSKRYEPPPKSGSSTRTIWVFLGGLIAGLVLSRLVYDCSIQTAAASGGIRGGSTADQAANLAASEQSAVLTGGSSQPEAPPEPFSLQCGIGIDASTLVTTCSKPCPMTESEAAIALSKQQARSDQLENEALNKPPEPRGAGEYDPNCRAAMVLTWAINRPEVTDVLEIGASFGGGSTAVFGRALKAKGKGEVWSMEAVPVKFKQARQYNLNEGLPSKLLLASAVAPEEMPTHEERLAAGDTRPADWLKGEVSVATLHGMGSMPHLCAAHHFGLIFVDGGAFTGPAEWKAINKYCSAVPWVALDDTHAKTIDILVELQNDPNPQWEVVYEELSTRDKELYDGVGESGLLNATSRRQDRPFIIPPSYPS